MDWDLILGIGRFVLATTLILLLTVPTAFVIIQMEMKIIAQLALRYGPNRIGSRCWPRRTPSRTRPIAASSRWRRGWSTWRPL
jgi:hypothetical protein